MAHHRTKPAEETTPLDSDLVKFFDNYRSLIENSNLMVKTAHDFKTLYAEFQSNLAELNCLISEVNTIATKWSIEPIPHRTVKFRK